MSQDRFRDEQVTAGEFTDEILVRCPRCDQLARLVPRTGARRLVCAGCGHAADLTAKVLSWPGNQGRAEFCDPFDLGLSLYLQTPCCGETLWAFNQAHVDYLESYVAATLRERSPEPTSSAVWHRRMTLTAKLPAWIKSAKNRDEVLRSLTRLRAL